MNASDTMTPEPDITINMGCAVGDVRLAVAGPAVILIQHGDDDAPPTKDGDE